MSEETVTQEESKKIWTPEERRRLKPTKAEKAAARAQKGKPSPARSGAKYLNPLKFTFKHIRGKLRFEKCFRYEKAPCWHCLHYWDKGDVRTLWLSDTDWSIKTKAEPVSPRTLNEMLDAKPLPLGIPTETKAPEPVPEPPKAAPTECYPIAEVRNNAKAYLGIETVTANAEANFARQEADRKIAMARHRNEVRTVAGQMSPATPVAAEWE